MTTEEPDAGEWLHALYVQEDAVAIARKKQAWAGDQAGLGAAAVPLLVGDVERTTGLKPEIEIVSVGPSNSIQVSIRLAGSANKHRVQPRGLSMAGMLAGLAEVVAESVAVVAPGDAPTWPRCPQHDCGLTPQILSGHAFWVCLGRSHHPVARVGELPDFGQKWV